MTEVQVVLAAFDAELSKQLGCLISAPEHHQHDLVKKHHRGVIKVQELTTYYATKLPPYAFVPLLLEAGAQLYSKQEYDLAIESCFSRIVDLNLPAAPGLTKLSGQNKLSLHVQASYGLSSCQAAKALQRDPRLRQTSTHRTCLGALNGIKDACMQVLPHPDLYWLVFNSTVLLYEIGQPLISAGFHQETLPYYVFAAQALESHLQLSASQYLEWRVRVYAAAAHCHYALAIRNGTQRPSTPTAVSSSIKSQPLKASGHTDSETVNPLAVEAQQFLEEGLAQLQQIVDAQALDPVPPPAATTAALKAARAQLLVLKLLFQPAGTPQQASTKDQLIETLQPIGPIAAKLSAVLQLLAASANDVQQPLQQLELPSNLNPALDAAMELAKPLADLAAAAEGCTNAQDLTHTVNQVDAVIPEQSHLNLLCIAHQYKHHEWLEQLLAAASARELCKSVDRGDAQDSLRASTALFKGLLQLQSDQGDANILRVATCLKEHSCTLAASVPQLLGAAAGQLYTAAEQLLQGCFNVEDSQSETVLLVLEGLHEALQCCGCDDGLLGGTVGIRLALLLEQKGELDRGKLVIQQALSLISSARCDALYQLADAPDEHLRWITGSCIQAKDSQAALMAGMTPSEQELACIHADALLIQQRMELAAGLKDARAKTAAKQEQMVMNTVKRDKQSAIYGARTAKDKRLDDAAIEAAGRPPSNAAVCERQLMLACGKNNSQLALLLTQIATYQKDSGRQVALLEEACDLLEAAQIKEEEMFSAQQPSASSQAANAHNSGLFRSKILCRTAHSITLTHFPIDKCSNQQPAAFAVYCKQTGAGIALSINSTAMEYPGCGVKVPIGSRVTIHGLQSNETYIFAIAVYDDQGHIIGELGPSTPGVVMALPLPIYSSWAHILLTAAQLQHWGVAKRAAGVLLPRFITSAPLRPVWQEHPMDCHHLQLQQVKSAPSPLLRLLVQAIYVYAGTLGTKLQEQLLYGVGQGRGDAVDAEAAANKLASTAASRALLLQYNKGQVPDQMALLSICKKLVIGMQVASVLADEMLLQEGALRLFNLLTPMLQQNDISPLVHQALANLHLALSAIHDTAPAGLAGHSKQRMLAARATAAASYWLMRMSAPISPDLAVGAISVLRGSAARKSSHSISVFAQLDSALLKALAPTDTVSVNVLPDPASPAPGKRATKTSTIGTAAGKAGKSGKKEQQIAPEGSVVAGAPPRMATAEVAAAAEQMVELVAAQELVLMHPDGSSWGSQVVSARLQDSLDLPAQILPKLHTPGVLTTCWPILAADASRAHARWLPLCVMVMEAAVTQYGSDLLLAMSTSKVAGLQGYAIGLGLTAEALTAMHMNSSPVLLAAAAAGSELVGSVIQHVRLAARKPQLDWCDDHLWGVEGIDSSLQEQGYALGALGTVPEPAAPQFSAEDTEEMRSAALEAWQQQKADLLVKERRRLAAAIFLQGCLPAMMKRRHAILHVREQLRSWGPWLARLHCLLGSLAAEAAAKLAASNEQVPAVTPASGLEDPDDLSATHVTSEEGGVVSKAALETEADTVISASRRASGSTSRPGSAHKKSGAAAVAKAGKDAKQVVGKAEGSESPQLTELLHQLGVQALQQFSQAATLTARAGPAAWQELFKCCKQLWNVSRHLINHQPSLTGPRPPVAWVQSVLPPPRVPLLPADAPQFSLVATDTGDAAVSKVDSIKAKAGAPAADKKAGDKSADKKGTGAVGSAKGGKISVIMPDEGMRQLLLPTVLGPDAANALSVVVDALLAVLHQLRQGVVFHPKTIPVQASTTVVSNTAAAGKAGNATTTAVNAIKSSSESARPISGRSAGSGISLGSDAIIAKWHTGAPVDMEGLTRLVVLVLKVMIRMQRWQKALSIGCRWLDICEGSADAMLLPLLHVIVQKAGGPADVELLAKAHQGLLQDKNAAFDALERVRLLVLDRLAPPSILSQQPGSPNKAARVKKGIVSKSGSGEGYSSQLLSLTGGLGAEPSRLSLISTKSKQTATDQMLLTAEYEKVVEQLSKRGEKGHMILALNELGDVHAQFGDWSSAGDAWNGALDALLGPYQVVHSWTSKLSLGSWQQILSSYGAHGLLLAGTLLGKLARYVYPCQLNIRLSAARLAAELLPAIFATDIIHPQRAVDCAVYVPVEIIPGADLFDDPYRCNAPDLLSALESLVGTLVDHHLHLQALPLLALWEHLALHVMHQTTSVLLARIQRVKALSRLGLLAEAAQVLQGLMLGSNLPGHLLQGPHPVIGSDGTCIGLLHGASQAASAGSTVHSKGQNTSAAVADNGGVAYFDATKGPGHATNAAIIECISEATLQPCIAAAYGQWICGQLFLARAAWLSAAGGRANCWRVTDPLNIGTVASNTCSNTSHGVSPVTTSGTTGAGARASTAAAGKDATAAVPLAPPATAMETSLLEKAAGLIQGLIAVSYKTAGLDALPSDFGWLQESSPAATGDTKKASSPTKDKGGKAGKAAGAAKHKASRAGAKQSVAGSVSDAVAGGSAEVTPQQALLQQQQRQLVIEGLMSLAQVELLRWRPLQALHLNLAAAHAMNSATHSSAATPEVDTLELPSLASSGPGGKGKVANDDVERCAIQPSCWLAGRCQLASILLHLKHYSVCTAVVRKALADSSRVGDLLWAAHLQHMQANALAAQGDAAEALNVMREVMNRLQEMSLSGSLMLSVQLNCAVLCDRLEARGEVDTLAGSALSVSSLLVEQQGLHEMLETPELKNIYLAATPAHISTLLWVATTSIRRRQLATAEKVLRQARTLLGYICSCPIQHAEVFMQLAKVLRLQAALKLPATDLVVQQQSASVLSQSAALTTAKAVVQPAASGIRASMAGADRIAPMNGAQLQLQRLQEAAGLLTNALQLLVSDGGSHPLLVRRSLLEYTTVCIQLQQLQGTVSTDTLQRHDDTTHAQAQVVADALKSAFAALQAAHVTAGHIRTLYLTPHQLQPVTDPHNSVPGWLVDWLKGQEQLQATQAQQLASIAAAAAAAAGRLGDTNKGAANKQTQQKQHDDAGTSDQLAAPPAAAATVADATLGHLAVLHYVQQLTAGEDGLAGLEQRHLAVAQGLQVQAALMKACPKLVTQCCWTQVPVLTGAAITAAGGISPADSTTAVNAEVPAGGVYVQWYRQDCCWQVPGSWRSDGCLPLASTGTRITREVLHQLTGARAYVSCLYIVNLPAVQSQAASKTQQVQQSDQQQPELMMGEVVVDLERLKRLQLQAISLRRRLESPGAPSDLFAVGLPSVKELAAAKHSIEGMLAGIAEEDMCPAPTELPPPAVIVSAATAVTTTSGSTTASAAGSKTVAAVSNRPAASASAPGAKQTAGSLLVPSTGGATDASRLDWTDVSTWTRVEALLDVEDGLQATDGGIAVWLGQVLRQQHSENSV